jgi:hypothetical protein
MKKLIIVFMICVVLVTALALPAFAAGNDIEDIIGVAFEDAVASILGSIKVILPIALPILGISIAIAYSVKFFKKLTGKA